ncbi:hypothetical protein TNCT_669241 [Trichonephila clavata]|uniref:Uncharacterized protein n=1 Tax=Trichonephila clavata TaxID=2740835 RepID=A0A8X6J105_TRICU|nr:hypothetical protein TNCT_669241 [Trichonephila clavata]
MLTSQVSQKSRARTSTIRVYSIGRMMNSDSDSDMDANSLKSSYKSRSPVSTGSRVSRPQTPQEHCRNLKLAMEGFQKAERMVKSHEKIVSENHPADIHLCTEYLKEAVISRDQKIVLSPLPPKVIQQSFAVVESLNKHLFYPQHSL